MPRKVYKPEEIVAKLRQVDVLTSQDQRPAGLFDWTPRITRVFEQPMGCFWGEGWRFASRQASLIWDLRLAAP